MHELTERVLRDVLPKLVALYRSLPEEALARKPVAAVFDVATALRTGLCTADEVGADPDPAQVVPKLVPCDQLGRYCADEPRLQEWLLPEDDQHLLVVVRTPFECSVLQVPLEAPPAAPAPDPWQQFGEEEQSYSLWLKHQAGLCAMAQAALREQPDRRVVGLVLAPELARNARHDGQPVPGEATGELVHLIAQHSAEQMLAGSPLQLERLRSTAPGSLPILVGTESGWMLKAVDLAT